MGLTFRHLSASGNFRLYGFAPCQVSLEQSLRMLTSLSFRQHQTKLEVPVSAFLCGLCVFAVKGFGFPFLVQRLPERQSARLFSTPINSQKPRRPLLAAGWRPFL
jgi:hypothetical protein